MARLLELCELIVDCEHKTAPTQETGYPSIRTPNIGRGRLILDGVNRVCEETYHAWTQREVPQPGDLILAREAPIGNVAIIPPGLKVCLGQRTVLIRANRKTVNPQYLTYLLLGDEIQGRILSISNGATVHHLNMKDIRELELPPMPDLPIQDRIADILSAYDDLIENNTRRITILEDMAQMLYREWFVNFRFPGHEKVRMVESELGPIPEGWEAKKIGEIALTTDYVANGSFASLKENVVYREEPDFAVLVRLTDFKNGWAGPFVYVDESSFRFLRKSSLVPGDIVIANVGAYAGTVFRVPKLKSATTLGPNAVLLRPHTTPEFFFYWLSDNDGQHRLRTIISGSAQPKFNKTDCRNLPVPLPPESLRAQFGRTVEPLDSLLENLRQKSVNLRTTRDLLLPKLISGEIPVEAAEQAMEQTA